MRDTVTVEEIDKWLDRIEAMVDKIEVFDTKGEEMLTNMNAYISDCKHFKEKEDLVRSFEAVIWSWSIYKLCIELNVFKQIVE